MWWYVRIIEQTIVKLNSGNTENDGSILALIVFYITSDNKNELLKYRDRSVLAFIRFYIVRDSKIGFWKC